MVGMKMIDYIVLNDEAGQEFKKQFLKKHNAMTVKEDEKSIIITVVETFDTNEFMWA